jgi:uncharacterized protein (TIGR02246 family)
MTTTASQSRHRDDVDGVRELLRRLYAAWADNDAEARAALYRDDATVVMPAVLHRGRAAVRDYMAAALAGPLKGSRGVDQPQDIRMIGPDCCGEAGYHLHTLQVFDVTPAGVRHAVVFQDPRVFAVFGLVPRLRHGA